MAEQQCRDFSFCWERSFPGVDLPDLDFLNVLKDHHSSEEKVAVVMEKDLKSLNIQKETLEKKLDQVQFCVTWINKTQIASAEEFCEEYGLKIETVDHQLQSELNDYSEGATLAEGSEISDGERLETSNRGWRSFSLTGERVEELTSWEERRSSDGCTHLTRADILRIEGSRKKSPYVNVLLSKSLSNLPREPTPPELPVRRLTHHMTDPEKPLVHSVALTEASKDSKEKAEKGKKRPSDLFLNMLSRSQANSESDCPSPLASPLTPSCTPFDFVIKVISDHRPSSGSSEPSLDQFRRFVLVRGECMDVIGLHGEGTVGEHYIARNAETEMGLVPKEKCEINYEATPLIWQKEWFVTSSKMRQYRDLIAQAQTGTFYIRNCSRKVGDFCLVVKTGKNPTKFQIGVHKSHYSISSRSSGPRSFLSLEELIAFYKTHSLTVDNQSNICLTIPCKRMESVSN